MGLNVSRTEIAAPAPERTLTRLLGSLPVRALPLPIHSVRPREASVLIADLPSAQHAVTRVVLSEAMRTGQQLTHANKEPGTGERYSLALQPGCLDVVERLTVQYLGAPGDVASVAVYLAVPLRKDGPFIAPPRLNYAWVRVAEWAGAERLGQVLNQWAPLVTDEPGFPSLGTLPLVVEVQMAPGATAKVPYAGLEGLIFDGSQAFMRQALGIGDATDLPTWSQVAKRSKAGKDTSAEEEPIVVDVTEGAPLAYRAVWPLSGWCMEYVPAESQWRLTRGEENHTF